MKFTQYILRWYYDLKKWFQEKSANSPLPRFSYNIPDTLKKVLPGTCCVCGQPLMGVYYKDWDNNCACEQHKTAFCHSCHRLYGLNAVEVEPNVHLCYSCVTHLITRQSSEHIVGRIRYFYRQQGIVIKSSIRLKVITASEMIQQKGENCQGYVVYPPKRNSYLVVVLRHLSQSVFASVMAHELLHVWQFENNVQPPPALCEGFCNLGSYLFMQSIGSPTAKGQLMLYETDKSEIYGNGFRQIKAIYDRQGWQGVIQEISK